MHRARGVRDEAAKDLEAAEGEEALLSLAWLQAGITRWLLRVQRAFLGHQGLFLIAGLVSVMAQTFGAPGPEPPDPSTWGVIRQVAIPLDLVLAQAIIVVGQVFLMRTIRVLGELYRWQAPSPEPSTAIQKMATDATEERRSIEEKVDEILAIIRKQS